MPRNLDRAVVFKNQAEDAAIGEGVSSLDLVRDVGLDAPVEVLGFEVEDKGDEEVGSSVHKGIIANGCAVCQFL